METKRHDSMADLLIVDDDVEMAELLTEFLQGEGHQVRIAHDGAEGLKLINDRLPDLVLLDVEMPKLDGPGMAHALLLHNLGFENIPVLLTSGILSLREVAASVGTPYFLSKPYTFEGIRSTSRVPDERVMFA